MRYGVTDPLRSICRRIVAEGKAEGEWADVESDDMFQEGNVVGGFDADENEFCFSVYLDDGEYWFQVSLADVRRILDGKLTTVDITPAV